MALTGMYAASGWAYGWGEYGTHSWTIEIEPAHAFAQVTLADFWEMDDESTTYIGFSQLTHRKSSGKDKTIDFASNFASMGTDDITRIVEDDNMSSVTVKMGVEDVFANWMLQIFLFD